MDAKRSNNDEPIYGSLPETLTDSVLKSQEGIIERWKRDGYKAGLAFKTIRDLWPAKGVTIKRRHYKTFADYCQGRWGISGSRARQFIGLARFTETTGIELQTEYPVRPLLRLASSNPEKAAEVYRHAAEAAGGTPTERHVREALQLTKPEPSGMPSEATEMPQEPSNGTVPHINGQPQRRPLESPLMAAIESWLTRTRTIEEALITWRYLEGLNQEEREELRTMLKAISAVNRKLRHLL